MKIRVFSWSLALLIIVFIQFAEQFQEDRFLCGTDDCERRIGGDLSRIQQRRIEENRETRRIENLQRFTGYRDTQQERIRQLTRREELNKALNEDLYREGRRVEVPRSLIGTQKRQGNRIVRFTRHEELRKALTRESRDGNKNKSFPGIQQDVLPQRISDSRRVNNRREKGGSHPENRRIEISDDKFNLETKARQERIQGTQESRRELRSSISIDTSREGQNVLENRRQQKDFRKRRLFGKEDELLRMDDQKGRRAAAGFRQSQAENRLNGDSLEERQVRSTLKVVRRERDGIGREMQNREAGRKLHYVAVDPISLISNTKEELTSNLPASIFQATILGLLFAKVLITQNAKIGRHICTTGRSLFTLTGLSF